MKYGIQTINEARLSMGLKPVPWGDAPWLPANWTQIAHPTTPLSPLADTIVSDRPDT